MIFQRSFGNTSLPILIEPDTDVRGLSTIVVPKKDLIARRESWDLTTRKSSYAC